MVNLLTLCVLIFQAPTVITTIGELLHAAVAEGNFKKVEALLCQGAKVDFKNRVSSVKEIEIRHSQLLLRHF